jgi:tetratricopeptide (TPR) repeat protein
MKLPVLLVAFALVPAARVAAQEPQPAPPAQQEETAAVPQETVSAAPAGGDAQAHIDAGLSAFRKRRFGAARQHFEQAVAADPSSAAANFYLGYTIYKIAEPKRPFHPDKQRAAELFAKAYELDPGFKPAWSKRG